MLIDSLHVKAEAFAAVFADRPDLHDVITAHHLAHGGVTRRVKLAHYFTLAHGEAPTDAELSQRTAAFAEAVEAGVIAAPEIVGATETLEAWSFRVPLHAVSATPGDELVRILTARGIAKFFQSIHGWPPAKDEAVSALVSSFGYRPRAVVLVGDSSHDLQAARQSGLRFIHVNSRPEDDLAGADAIIRDLTGLTEAIKTVLGPSDE